MWRPCCVSAHWLDGVGWLKANHDQHRRGTQSLESTDRLLVPQTCPAVHDLMGYSQPGSSVCGILQAKILEWVAIPFSRGSTWSRVSCFAGRFFAIWATREAPKAMSLFLSFWKAVLPGIGFLLDSCYQAGFSWEKEPIRCGMYVYVYIYI